MDVVIPIVFPDYKIAVNTPKKSITIPKIPSWVPGQKHLPTLPREIVILPPTKQKLPYLGHAGVMIINGKSGLSKYYEYGRYDAAALGEVKRRKISDVKIAKDGRPTHKSLTKTLGEISKDAGQKGPISAAYIEVADGKFADMLKYCQLREGENSNPSRAPYTLTQNSCMHFAMEVAEAGGAKIPWIFDPRPNSFIGEVQAKHPALEFS